MKHSILITSILLLFRYACVAQQFYFNRLTSEEGLSHNTVFSIAQDYKGFMWLGTRDGITRYDSHQLKNYYFNVYSPTVEANRISCVYAVGQQLWVGTAVGLFRYVFATDTFEQVRLADSHVQVTEIKQLSTGDLWVASRSGIYILGKNKLVKHILPGQNIQSICEYRRGAMLVLQDNAPRIINAEGETLVAVSINEGGQEKLPSFRDYSFYKDRQGTIWLGTNVGLLQLDEKSLTFRIVSWYTRLVKNSIRVIRTITEDQAGNLWMGSESGVVVVDKQRLTARWYDRSFSANPYSLSDRAIYSSYVSRDGTVWLGTYFGGVNYAKPVGVSFNHLFAAPEGLSLSGKAVSQIVADGQHRLWIASEDGGVSIRDQTTGRFTYHNRKNGLSDDNVHALYVEKSGVAWVGTYLGGLNRIDPVSGVTNVYTHKSGDPTSISNNSVYAIHRDRNNTLWVGTVSGLNWLQDKVGTFKLFKPDILGKTFIYALLEDSAGLIWIATRYVGIYQYNPRSGQLIHYHAGNTKALRNNQIISIYEDSHRRVWFGSLDGGVCQWNPEWKTFTSHPVNTYLPSRTVYGILEDSKGVYWFSTNKGILSFNPGQKTYRVFDKSNGLQATQFNFKSYFKDEQGVLYFGSVDGLCYFNPDSISKQVSDPPVYFTGLKLFNKEVKADGKLMLSKDLDETKELVFNYDQNVVTLDFVAINYFSKRTHYYTYYLEGFEKTWRPKTTINSPTYTNLSPGTYTFHVRTFRSNGEPSSRERTIQLLIKPPFWQTNLAYLLYVLLGIGALLLYRRFITILNNQKVAVQLERVEREKSEELNQQKLNFFTFLSNEFKMPITLIMAEIDELIQSNQAWRVDSATNYSVIKNNAKRLKTLVDQITELRKTGSDLQKVHLTDQDLIAFVKETVQGFDPFLQSRAIRKRLSFSHPYLMASFDAGKLEMIIGNVFFYLANELAEEDELGLDIRIDSLTDPTTCQLTVTFLINGQQEPFNSIKASYQAVDNHDEFLQQNSDISIGILLAFNLVKRLSGSLSFSDNTNQPGLAIKLPIRRSPIRKAVVAAKKQDLLSSHILGVAADVQAVNRQQNETGPIDKPAILIADRSKDLAQFLKRHYQESYRIHIAHTFGEALKKAESTIPDIVLWNSDLGDHEQQNLCTVLKSAPLTQAIPVILLLDNEEEKHIIAGLNSGADGYIGKPFNLKELDLMIGNQLKSVSLLRNKMVGAFTDTYLTSLPRHNKEQEFLRRFSTLVTRHYKDKDITVDTLAQQMNCSRSQLHTKLKTLTGLSTKEYLNEYRLKVANQLLDDGLSVAEAAFEVGYNDANYFGRAFKKKYGFTPSRTNAHHQ